MSTITKLPILQYFNTLFKKPPEAKLPLEKKLAKQQNTSWTLSKTAKAASAILTTLGLTYVTYHHFSQKKIPFRDDPLINPTGNVSKIIAAITLSSSFAYFFKKEIFITNKENKTFDKKTEETQNIPILSQEITDKYAKFNELIKNLEDRSLQESWVYSDFKSEADDLCCQILLLDSDVTPDEWELQSKTIKNLYFLLSNIDPNSAILFAEMFLVGFKIKSDDELYIYFTKEVKIKKNKENISLDSHMNVEDKKNKENISGNFNEVEEPKKDVEPLKNNDNEGTIIISTSEGDIELSSQTIIGELWSQFNGITAAYREKTFTQETCDKVVNLFERLSDLGRIDETSNEVHKKLVSALALFIQCIIVIQNAKSTYKDEWMVTIARNAFKNFLNINIYDALLLANSWVSLGLGKQNNPSPLAIECLDIVRYAKENDAIAIDFAMICAGGTEEHQKIAEEIWLNCLNSIDLDKKIQYLIACSKKNNVFCQNKLLEESLSNILNLSLIQACSEHLFEESKRFDSLVGNRAVIFKALCGVRDPDKNSFKIQLSLGERMVTTFQKAKNIADDDLPRILCTTAADTETEFRLRQEVGQLKMVVFNLYLFHSDYARMKSLLQNCLETTDFDDFLKRAEKLFDKFEDKKWKQIFDEVVYRKKEQENYRIA